jgi:hypothetical protein
MGQLVDRDQEHLTLLKWAFYTLAGMGGLFSLFSLLYIGMGGLFLRAIPSPAGTDNGQRFAASFFLGIGIGFLLVGLTITFLTYFAGRNVAERRHRVFCLIVAGLWCLSIPFGTILGVCAILVLNRPSVVSLFENLAAPPALPHLPQSGPEPTERPY